MDSLVIAAQVNPPTESDFSLIIHFNIPGTVSQTYFVERSNAFITKQLVTVFPFLKYQVPLVRKQTNSLIL